MSEKDMEEVVEEPKKVSKKVSKPEHKLVVRTIGMGADPSKGVYSVDQTDQYINQFLANGWTLENSMFVGNGPIPSTWIFAWILLRY